MVMGLIDMTPCDGHIRESERSHLILGDSGISSDAFLFGDCLESKHGPCAHCRGYISFSRGT
jgi:hypothetical protein